LAGHKKRKREYLIDSETKLFTAELHHYFVTWVNASKIRVGERQTLETTLISKKAMLFAKFLRNEKKNGCRVGFYFQISFIKKIGGNRHEYFLGSEH